MKVLLVEDQESEAEEIIADLEAHGHEVVKLANFNDSILWVMDNGMPDLVLLDRHLPLNSDALEAEFDVNMGFEIASSLARKKEMGSVKWEDAKVVIWTRDPDDEFREKAAEFKEKGLVDYWFENKSVANLADILAPAEPVLAEDKNLILLVEDKEGQSVRYRKALEENDFKVISVTNQEDALDALEQNSFLGILCDANFPRVEGGEIESNLEELIAQNKGDAHMILWSLAPIREAANLLKMLGVDEKRDKPSVIDGEESLQDTIDVFIKLRKSSVEKSGGPAGNGDGDTMLHKAFAEGRHGPVM